MLKHWRRWASKRSYLGRALVEKFAATGINIFQNNGIDANQHHPHYHMHVVPRYPGSDPTKIYSEADFAPISLAQQRALAARIRDADELAALVLSGTKRALFPDLLGSLARSKAVQMGQQSATVLALEDIFEHKLLTLRTIGSTVAGTTTLYRPVGPAELERIAASGWHSFPPRLPEQPFFYPVLNEEYAAQIAERWNVRDSGAGYVTAFDVDAEYIAKFDVKQVGGPEHQELWVPAEELPTFNQHIVGVIRVVREFGAKVT